MGEILFLSMTSETHSELEVRAAADWVVRKRLLGLPGVAQAIPLGGASSSGRCWWTRRSSRPST